MEKPPQQSFEERLQKNEARRARRLESVAESNLERIQAGHQAAAAAYRVERIVIQSGAEANQGEIDAEMERLSPELREPFLHSISRYRYHERQAAACESSLKEHSEKTREYGWEGSSTPDAWGDIFFRQFVHDEPEGTVIFERREAYFVMICSDPSDYVRAVEATRVSGEAFDASHTAGIFHRAHLINFYQGGKKEHVPLMIVDGNQPVRRVIAHERQHFLNENILSDFEETEALGGRKERNPIVQRLYRGIKDEVLAYLRDGSSGTDIEEALGKDAYRHLFRPLPSSDEEAAWMIVGRIKQFLDRHHGSFDGDSARGILTYQLAPVPLREFPKYLNALEIYYGERFRMLREFEAIDLENADDLQLRRIAEDMFPPQCGAEADSAQFRLRNALDKLEALQEAANHLAYNPNIDIRSVRPVIRDSASQYRALCGEIRKMLAPLRRNGVILPHATEARVQEGSRSVAPIELQRMDRMRHAVLEKISLLPQDVLDEIAEYLKHYSGPRPRVLTKLYQAVREAVQGEIETKTVRMDPYLIDAERGVFGADVRVKTAREDSEFSITLYSSQPGLI